MSMAAVTELADELRLLAIAGSGAAKGNRRIAALVPALEKTGEKVPVFARIAVQAKALTSAPKRRAAADLLSLNTLVGAVLKTRGAAAPKGVVSQLPDSPTVPRNLPASELNALRDASRTGCGIAVQHTIAARRLHDPRLAALAVDLLRDGSEFVRRRVSANVIPRYGEAIVPSILSALGECEPDQYATGRLIEAWSAIDPENAARLARQLLDPNVASTFSIRRNGSLPSTEVRRSALRCLGDDVHARALLARHIDSNDRETRLIVRRRLCALDDDSVKHLKVLSGSSAASCAAIDAIGCLSDGPLADVVLERVEEFGRRFADVPPPPKGRSDKALSRSDANALASLVRLLLRSGRDYRSFEVLRALFPHVERLIAKTSAFGTTSVMEMLEYVTHPGQDLCSYELRSVTEVAVRLDAGRTVRVLVDSCELWKAGDALRDAGRSQIVEGLKAYYDVDVSSSGPFPDDRLPPPNRWSRYWLRIGLDHELVGLVEHLLTLDQISVVEAVLKLPKSRVAAFAHVALLADPRCARRLKARLPGRTRACAVLVSLCNAIERRDSGRCEALAGELAAHVGEDRAAALGKHLAAWIRKNGKRKRR